MGFCDKPLHVGRHFRNRKESFGIVVQCRVRPGCFKKTHDARGPHRGLREVWLVANEKDVRPCGLLLLKRHSDTANNNEQLETYSKIVEQMHLKKIHDHKRKK